MKELLVAYWYKYRKPILGGIGFLVILELIKNILIQMLPGPFDPVILFIFDIPSVVTAFASAISSAIANLFSLEFVELAGNLLLVLLKGFILTLYLVFFVPFTMYVLSIFKAI